MAKEIERIHTLAQHLGLLKYAFYGSVKNVDEINTGVVLNLDGFYARANQVLIDV